VKCPECGEEHADSDAFCIHCGAGNPNVDDKSVSPPPPPQTDTHEISLTPPPHLQLPRTDEPSPKAATLYQVTQVQGIQITEHMVWGGIGVVSMLTVALGSALPWANASLAGITFSKNGLSGDGIRTLILAVIGLAVFAAGAVSKVKAAFIIGLFLSLFVLAMTSFDAVDLTRVVPEASVRLASVTVGVGLILCIIGGAIGLIAGIGGTRVTERT
jgi:zinc-ribbon domain